MCGHTSTRLQKAQRLGWQIPTATQKAPTAYQEQPCCLAEYSTRTFCWFNTKPTSKTLVEGTALDMVYRRVPVVRSWVSVRWRITVSGDRLR